MPRRVSLCLTVKNEQDNLPSCLRSVAELVHEMIVVDTGSTDRSKEVAAALGARVFDFTWVDSFAAARNESLRHASGNWIFWLDADEYLDEANRQKVRVLLAKLGQENAAYSMKQCSAPKAARSGSFGAAAEALLRLIRLGKSDAAVSVGKVLGEVFPVQRLQSCQPLAAPAEAVH